jgi:nitrate/nitrite transporter NarK
MNTFGNLGGMLSPVIVGWSLTAWGSWETPLYSVAGFYLLAAACWLGIDPEQALGEAGPASAGHRQLDGSKAAQR